MKGRHLYIIHLKDNVVLRVDIKLGWNAEVVLVNSTEKIKLITKISIANSINRYLKTVCGKNIKIKDLIDFVNKELISTEIVKVVSFCVAEEKNSKEESVFEYNADSFSV